MGVEVLRANRKKGELNFTKASRTDAGSALIRSPYGRLARQGATITPRALTGDRYKSGEVRLLRVVGSIG